MSKVRYSVSLNQVATHLLDVRLEIDEPDAGGQVLSLPAWIPGSYMIRDFAKNLVRFEASCAGRCVAWEKLDKQTWRCEPVSDTLRVDIQVYAWDLSVRSAHCDITHAYFNGTSVFLRVHGQSETSLSVELKRPELGFQKAWSVATSLVPEAADSRGFGVYCAEDYEDLIDHPVEIAELSSLSFEVQEVVHRMSVYGRHQWDDERLAGDLQRICRQHAGMFGELPLDRYEFLVMAVGKGYGGLEHRFSTSLLCSRDDLPKKGDATDEKAYRGFLGLCSHEYFHLWNVKRIRPRVFQLSDLSEETYTQLLWVFEGFTSYYDDLCLVRSGCISAEQYLELLAQIVTRVVRGKGRFKQSVAESSFDAWTKFYKQDENAPNAIVSYYAKGALVALALDVRIRQATADGSNLDDLMRLLWQRYGKTGEGVAEGDVEALVEELTGAEFGDFFTEAVYGTSDLDLDGLLAYLGVGVHFRPAKDAKDAGGFVTEISRPVSRSVLGIRLKDSAEAEIAGVFEGAAAALAGLSAGDQIIALNGLQINAANLEKRVAESAPGDRLEIHAFRRDELLRFELQALPAEDDTCELSFLDVDGPTARRRAGWLGSAPR